MSGGAPVVSIVIPTFGKLELTRGCLAAIAKTAADVPHEVLVVDNASPDETPAFLRAEHEAGRLRAILNDENEGFGRACNRGAAAARGRYVLLLNNDTLPHPGWLAALVGAIEEDPEVGAVGSRLLYPDGRVQHAGLVFTENLRTDHAYRYAPGDHPAVLRSRDYPAVTGACLLVPKALWDELGGLDEGYRHYVEDVDLCLRIWAAGRRVRYCAESVVTHLEQQSAPSRAWADALVLEGWRRFHERWWGRWPKGMRELCDVPLPGGARRFAVLALADELATAPELLAAYASQFRAGDDATLVVFAPGSSEDALAAELEPVLVRAGADGEDGPDLLAVAGAADAASLARDAQALLSRRDGDGPLAGLPRFDDTSVAALRAEAERAWAA